MMFHQYRGILFPLYIVKRFQPTNIYSVRLTELRTGKDFQMIVKIMHSVDNTLYISRYISPAVYTDDNWTVFHECPLESHEDLCDTEDVTLAIQEAISNPISTLEIETGKYTLKIKS